MRRSSFMPSSGLMATALLIVGSLSSDACPEGNGRIEGTVIDPTGVPVQGAQVIVVGTSLGALTDTAGHYALEQVPEGLYAMRAQFIGYQPAEVQAVLVEPDKAVFVDFHLQGAVALGAITVTVHQSGAQRWNRERADVVARYAAPSVAAQEAPYDWQFGPPPTDREEYGHLVENPFLAVAWNPLSTFGVDVDRASYANMRRFLMGGRLPPVDAVRIEEFINYFTYDYAEPTGPHPIAIHTEVAAAPWRPAHRLVRIGLQARRIETEGLPPSNLVFLLDVSGSMQPQNKLPLVQSAFRLLVDQLRPEDRVAIVVYAGAAGLVLPSVSGDRKAEILAAIDRLSAGGSTAGGEGLQLAYDIAEQQFIDEGNNRVILATDGDFNVGVSGEGGLVRLIEERRESGVFLTVLSVGEGNLQDRKMEQLADHGNGNYAYLDTMLEARKVFVEELLGTLYTVAKDVKIQIEFNPSRVAAYRLIGYENRLLRDEEFDDDTRDAGDMGAGHSVTALYEVIPVGVESDVEVWTPDSLRYHTVTVDSAAGSSPELAFVKFRYKDPDGDESRLLTYAVVENGTAPPSNEFLFQTAVVEFGLLLRQSEYRGEASVQGVLDRARRSLGADERGHRAEFLRLVAVARDLGLENKATQ